MSFSTSLRSILVIGAAALSSASALAQGTGFFNTDFCNKPIDSVCNNLSMNASARSKRIEKRRKNFASTALTLTIRKHGLDPNRVKSIQDVDKLGLRFIDRLAVYDTYNGFLNSISGVVTSIEAQQRLGGHIQTVKNLLLSAIEKEFPISDKAAKKINAKMRKEVNRTKIVQMADVDAIAKKKPADGKELREAFAEGCGADGLGQNAFAYMSNDKTKYLAVCPGWLLASSGNPDDERTNLENLVQVLGHEWGHHIDSQHFFDQYVDFGNCILRNYSHALSPLDLNTLKPEVRAKLDPKINFNDPLVKVELHLREMTADLWGARVVEQYLLWNGLLWDRMRKMNVLRESFGGLCATKSEGIHPTGDFRVELLLGHEPGVRQAMGCSPVKTGYACTLKGLE